MSRDCRGHSHACAAGSARRAFALPSKRSTATLLVLAARISTTRRLGVAPVEITRPVGLPEDERPDGERAFRHGDDAEDVGEQERERQQGDGHARAHHDNERAHAERGRREQRRIKIDDPRDGGEERGDRCVQHRPGEVDERPLEVQRLELFACRPEQFERVDEVVERAVSRLGQAVRVLCADAARRVQFPRVVVVQRGGHHIELAELGAVETAPDGLGVPFRALGPSRWRTFLCDTDVSQIVSTDSDTSGDGEMEKINVRVPQALLAEVDSVWEERGYTNKSEFIRDALRDAVEPPTELSAEALHHLAESREQREDGETVSQADVKDRLGLDD